MLIVENLRARKVYKERRVVRDQDCKVLYQFQPANIVAVEVLSRPE
jgi:hypothetical protein